MTVFVCFNLTEFVYSKSHIQGFMVKISVGNILPPLCATFLLNTCCSWQRRLQQSVVALPEKSSMWFPARLIHYLFSVSSDSDFAHTFVDDYDASPSSSTHFRWSRAAEDNKTFYPDEAASGYTGPRIIAIRLAETHKDVLYKEDGDITALKGMNWLRPNFVPHLEKWLMLNISF